MGAKRRVAFVLIDGIGDVSIPKFSFQTPLEAADVPFLDALAFAGLNGLMDPVEVGLACGSDTAHLSLLGYDPRVYYRGRGAFESMGAGLPMSPGDIAFKSNFATLDEQTGIVVSRRADRHFEEEGPILCASLDGIKLPSFPEYDVRVRYATEHRCGVVLKGPNLSGNISGTDPLKDNRLLLKAASLDGNEDSKHTADVVNELSKEISRVLSAHPINAERISKGKNVANVVLLRGCGIRIEVPPFAERHGLSACMVAPTKIIAGLGMSLGIHVLEVEGATGDYRTVLTSKATAIAEALSGSYEFGFLHVKAIDDAGHDKASGLKVKGLEAVDMAIGQLLKLLWEKEKEGEIEYLVAVTGDHSTPVEYGDHSYETVPFAVCRVRDFVSVIGENKMGSVSLDCFPFPQVKEDEVVNLKNQKEKGKVMFGDEVGCFNEIAASRGCLGRFPGGQMMGIIKACLNDSNVFDQI